MAMTEYYQRVEHTADLAIEVWGRDLRDLFVNAARALFDMMAEPPADDDISRRIELESVDHEGLLVDWLNELIYLNEVEGETYTAFSIEELSDEKMLATARGGRTTLRLKGIKAATFHDLVISETPEGVKAHIVFDV